MKQYQLIKKDGEKVFGTFHSKLDASNEMMKIIRKENEDRFMTKEEKITPSYFDIKEIEVEDICEKINSYESALRYLDYGEDIQTKISSINSNHAKALYALNILFTIADAWNKADNFIPDFNNMFQYKYFSWFMYNEKEERFEFAWTDYALIHVRASYGYRLCFKSERRAEQFGRQFIDLWNDILLK